jgi:hypothetical protein
LGEEKVKADKEIDRGAVQEARRSRSCPGSARRWGGLRPGGEEARRAFIDHFKKYESGAGAEVRAASPTAYVTTEDAAG